MRLIYIFVILAAVFGESVYGIYAARAGRSTPTKQYDITLPAPGYLDFNDVGAFELNSDNYYEATAASGNWPTSNINGPSFSSQLSYEHFISFSGHRNSIMSEESKKKDNPVVAIFWGCFLCLSLLLIFINIFCICGSWRKEYDKLEEFEVNGKMVKIATENRTLAEKERHPCEAGVVKSYGIRRNCCYENEADCTWPDNFGFVGDEAILIMVCIPLCLNVINLIIPCVSLCLNKVSFILPITCLIHFSLMLASVIVCGVSYGKTYSSSKKLESNPTFAALYKMDGDMVIGPHPYIIEFASNFNAACVAAGFSIF